jgi:hypothetical protein
MGKTYTIAAKSSNEGCIHDIASEHGDREIRFAPGCQYAVVRASYYGGKGYTTHKTSTAAALASKAQGDYSHEIIDAEGNRYAVKPGYYSDTLIRV